MPTMQPIIKPIIKPSTALYITENTSVSLLCAVVNTITTKAMLGTATIQMKIKLLICTQGILLFFTSYFKIEF